jgi:hypothetical protein
MTRSIIDSFATIKHLNIRKQGPDEDKVLAIDIKFSDCQADIELLARLLGSDPGSCLASFWSGPDIRFPGMEPIQSWSTIEGCTMHVGGFGGLRLTGAAKKFRCTVEGEHMVTMEFQFSVADPPENATATLAEYVAEQVRVILYEDQADLFESEQQHAA